MRSRTFAAVSSLVAVLAACVIWSPSAGAAAVPGTIAADCSVDVTAPLQTWIDGQSNGAILAFAGGCFRVDGTLTLNARANLTVDGQGATFKAVTQGDRTRAMWRTDGSSGISFKAMTVIGANPHGGTWDDAYDATKEAQHGFDILSSTNVDIGPVTVTDIWGDYVYVGRGASGNWSDGVVVHDSTFARNGRQGLTVTAGRNITFRGNSLDDNRRAAFDLEPNGAGWGLDNILVENNHVGFTRLYFVASAGGGPVDHVTIRGNTLVGKEMNIYARDSGGARRGAWTITGNTSDFAAGTPGTATNPGYAMYFERVDGIVLRDNVVPVQSDRPMSMAGVWESTGIDVQHNTITGGVAVLTTWDDLGHTNTIVQNCGNRFSASAAFDQPIACAPNPCEAPVATTTTRPPTTTTVKKKGH